MHCPNCRQEIEAGSEFCGNCGLRIESHPVEQTCPECGSLLLPGAEFCAECGTRLGGEILPAQAFCPECGATVRQSAAFCRECGARLDGKTTPVQSVCPGCGEPLDPQAAFCGNCGQILKQTAEYAPAAPEMTATEYRPSYQPQDSEYSQQQDWAQPQVQLQPQDWEPVQAQQQWQESQQPQSQQQGRSAFSLPQGSGQRKILMAAAAAVILLVIGITGFWKPGYLLDLFRPTAKLENGILALNDITLDFKQTNLANGKATMTIVKEKEDEVHNGLIGDLYVMKIDKSCQGKVTVSVPAPKDFKPMNDDGLFIKLGIGRDYPLADGKTTRFYEYFDATIKDGKAVAVIDPATAGLGRHKSTTSAKPAEKAPDLGEFTEYMGLFWKQSGYTPKPWLDEGFQYGEGYQYSKGHFRLWYNYNVLSADKNVYMAGSDAQNLLKDMEEAYNYYKTHGFADYVDAFTPIDVYIEKTADEGGWYPPSGNMQISEQSLFGADGRGRYEGGRRTNVRQTIYHEFFHAVQQGIINIKGTLWFDEATATHFEKVVNHQAPQNVQSHFGLQWGGLIPENNTQEEGYGRAYLIDYISSKMGGYDWIRECYENWSSDYSKLKSIMRGIAGTEADFAANFYMEVIKKIGHIRPHTYYKSCRQPSTVMGEDRYLSAIRLELDKETKEKLAEGEIGKEPIVFTSPSFEIGGYGGHIVALVTQEGEGNNAVNLTKDFPDGCQLSLAAPGCRVQVIRFQSENVKNVESSEKSVINNFKEQIKKKYRYLALVTSNSPNKQKVSLKATLELLKEGIYNGKTTMTKGKQSKTANNRVGFRLSQGKDGQWGLNICQANGDFLGSAPNVPLTYDDKQKIWKGHRKFKEELSKDPKKSRAEVSNINCTMKVNTEGKEPILIVDYNVKITKLYVDYSFSGDASFKAHFEGKWSSDLKGKTLKTGKITILE